jgi:uncharacterized protein
MGRGFTIYFKDNKVSKVTGRGSPVDKVEAAVFAQAFVDGIVPPKTQHPTEPQPSEPAPESRRARKGFASMDPDKQRQIASKGGRAAHAKGTAHEFTSDEARIQGSKGGKAVAQSKDHMRAIGKRGGKAVSKDRKHMSRIGRKGVETVSDDSEHMAAIGRKGGKAKGKKT